MTRSDLRPHRRWSLPAAVLAVAAVVTSACGGGQMDAQAPTQGVIEQTAVGQAAPGIAGAEGVGQPASAGDPDELPARRQVPDATTSQGVPWTPWQFEPPADGDRPVGVWIPVIDVWSQLGALGLTQDGELEVPSDHGATGWYANSPRPGEVGPAVIAGHVDSRSGPAVFFRLRQLQADDLAHIVYESGYVATFRIAQVEQYGKDRFPTTRVYGDVDAPELRLITCGGSFDRATGHYRDNVVAYAELFSTWTYDPETGATA